MNIIEETSNWIRNSITLKLVIIGVLVLVLLIPTAMIQSLIRERNESHTAVVQDVTSKCGSSQLITGPILSIPYRVREVTDGKINESVAYAYFLPEKLNISGKINPEIRNRSIYQVMLYNSALQFQGQFTRPDFASLGIAEEDVNWSDAYITIGIPDMRGIRRKIEIHWNNDVYIGNPGVLNKDIVNSGVNTHINLSPDSLTNKFSFDLDLNGSQNISFLPLGKETHTVLQSPWNSPSFSGAFIPENKNLTPNGFNAEWNILHLNRNYPQQWTCYNNVSLDQSMFGVDLIFTADHYQKSTRSAKYAVMFLFLTFLVFFVSEIVNKSKIHPVQYLLIGLALTIFYTLLISLSEYLGFNLAYLIASLATISLITGYALNILSRKAGIITGIILSALYGFLFILLQLEDYSLMIGSIGLFIILACAMFASRKVDWYSPLNKAKAADE